MSPSVQVRLLDVPIVRHALIGAAAVAALILLVVFHSVVSGAVQQASAKARATMQLEAAARAAADARFAARPVLAVQAQPRLPQRYAPRTVAYRSAN
jgi:hypothetical protein